MVLRARQVGSPLCMLYKGESVDTKSRQLDMWNMNFMKLYDQICVCNGCIQLGKHTCMESYLEKKGKTLEKQNASCVVRYV